MNLFQTAMTNIGKSIGSGVTSGLDKLTSYLPSGAQSFLGSVGKYTGITTQSIGDFVGDIFAGDVGLYDASKTTKFSDLPQAPRITGVGPSGAKQLSAAGRAQMIPLGSSDRIARAMEDQRVQQKLMKMSQNYRVPSPNIRAGMTIGLASAGTPSATLSRKYTTVKK